MDLVWCRMGQASAGGVAVARGQASAGGVAVARGQASAGGVAVARESHVNTPSAEELQQTMYLSQTSAAHEGFNGDDEV